MKNTYTPLQYISLCTNTSVIDKSSIWIHICLFSCPIQLPPGQISFVCTNESLQGRVFNEKTLMHHSNIYPDMY